MKAYVFDPIDTSKTLRMPPSLDVTQKAFEPDGRILIRKRMELRTFVLGKRFAVVRHGLLTSTRVTKKQKQKKIWYETRRVVYSAEGKKSPQHQAVCQAYLDAPLMSDTARPDPPIPYESEPPGVLSQDRRILFSWNVIQMSCKKKKKKKTAPQSRTSSREATIGENLTGIQTRSTQDRGAPKRHTEE